MTNRSEHNLTEIMERMASRTHEANVQAGLVETPWDDLEGFQKSQFKQALLSSMMFVLDIADEVEAETREANAELAKARRVEVTQPFEAGHGRPDLDMLHQVVTMIDQGMWDAEDARNVVADYLNNRKDDR